MRKKMKFETIEDIYNANDAIRQRLLDLLEAITREDETLPTENGKWTLAKVAEHLSKVDLGMTRIAARLLSNAKEKGLESKERIEISDHFIKAAAKVREEGTKLVAPEIVEPEGGQSVAETIAVLNANRDQLQRLKPMFEQFDGTAFTFPHPAFGGLTAIDWLVLIGGHETRHTDQIERILSRRDAAKA